MTTGRFVLAALGLVMLAKAFQYSDGALYGSAILAFLVVALSADSKGN